MDGTQEAEASVWDKHAPVTEGEFAGWMKYGQDPFEDLTGPFYYRTEPDGRVISAFRAETKHMNGGMFMHGGCLMTFADYSLFNIARKDLQQGGSVTASFNGEFVDAVKPGELVIASGEVVKAGGSLVFIRGQLTVEGRTVFNFSAILKKIRRKL